MKRKTSFIAKNNKKISIRHNPNLIDRFSTAGITLISLVVTIIILMILAAVSINLVLGENGIITKAKEAKTAQEIASLKEEIQMKIAAEEMSKIEKGEELTQDDIEKILEEYGTVIKNSDGTIKSLQPTGKDYEIPFEELYNNRLAEGTEGTVIVAGLYDADGVMLCSWEESGIDVQTNYTYSTYKTNTTSPYYVLTNNYPTATKVVIPANKVVQA